MLFVLFLLVLFSVVFACLGLFVGCLFADFWLFTTRLIVLFMFVDCFLCGF